MSSFSQLPISDYLRYYYFIKVKSKNQFFLHYLDSKLVKTLKFNEDELSTRMIKANIMIGKN